MAYYVAPQENYHDTTTVPPPITDYTEVVPWEKRGIEKIKTYTSFDETRDLLYQHATKHNPRPMDPSTVTLAHLAPVFAKMVRLLSSPELVHRRKALLSLIELLRRPQHIVRSCEFGTVKALTERLTDEDTVVRQHAVKCLGYIAVERYGKTQVGNTETLEALVKRFDDPVAAVRSQTYDTLLMQCGELFAIEGVYATQCMPKLVSKCKHEPNNEIRPQILMLIRKQFKLEQAMIEVLDIGGLRVMSDLLEHKSWRVREEAARCIQDLCIIDDGKELAITTKCVPRLVALCSDKEEAVRMATSGALMNITIINNGKWSSIDHGATEALMALLDDPNLIVKVNTVKAIQNIAEDPQGRKLAQPCLRPLKTLSEVRNDLLSKTAKKCIAMITWEP